MSEQPSIFTAVMYRNDSEDEEVTSMVTQPLLHDEEADDSDYEEEYEEDSPEQMQCFHRFLGLGTITGFLIQVVSLGAYAIMLMRWGDQPVTQPNTEWFFHSILSILTQIDLCMYFLIWMSFTCTMTRGGMALVREHCQAPIRRRFVFVLGVNFLVGVVLGAFAAWTLIDIYLGFPIPFLPIVATVLVDLVLCYLMVWCYDLGKEETIEDEENTSCC